MKKFLLIVALASLFVACEKEEPVKVLKYLTSSVSKLNRADGGMVAFFAEDDFFMTNFAAYKMVEENGRKELKEKLFVELFDQEVAKTLTRDDVFNSSYMISEGGVTVTRVNFRYYRVEVDPNCDYDIIYFSLEDFYDNNILPYTLEVALTPIPLMGIE